MLNFDDEINFSFQYKNKAHQVRCATKKDVENYGELLKNAGEDNDKVQDVAYEFLTMLGVDRNVLEELPMKCVAQLVDEAIGLQKK